MCAKLSLMLNPAVHECLQTTRIEWVTRNPHYICGINMKVFHATDFKSSSQDNVDNCFAFADMTFLHILYMIWQSVRLTVIPCVAH